MPNPIVIRNRIISLVILAIAALIIIRTPDAEQGVELAVGWVVAVVTLWMKSGRTEMSWKSQRRGASKLPVVAVLLTMHGCAFSTLSQQRAISALHSKALNTCRIDGSKCKAILPCSKALSNALWSWQRAQRLLAGLPADPAGADVPRDMPEAPSDALLAQAGAYQSEYEARTICRAQGVQ